MRLILYFLTFIFLGYVSAGDLVKIDTEDLKKEVVVEIEKEGQIGNQEPFLATKEWQEIKPDQAIPRGLHVRLNLQTGLKEAKIWDRSEDSKEDSFKTVLQEEEDELKKIEHVPIDGPQVKKRKFRSMQELKKDFEKMNMNVKTDIEIIQRLTDDFNTTQDLHEKVHFLQDLEYYLHQIDNAINFADIGGMSMLVNFINDSLIRNNSISDLGNQVLNYAAMTIGSAIASNTKVQIEALETNLLPTLLATLVPTSPVNYLVRLRSLYALSALLRHFPYAQTRFFKAGGIEVLSQIFITEPAVQQDARLLIKAITLMNDILLEQKSVSRNDTVKYEQYEVNFQLPVWLREKGWCNFSSDVLMKLDPDGEIDHDFTEKLFSFMPLLLTECRQIWFIDNNFKAAITLLEGNYHQLSLEEKTDHVSPSEADFYYSKLYESIGEFNLNFQNFRISDEL